MIVNDFLSFWRLSTFQRMAGNDGPYVLLPDDNSQGWGWWLCLVVKTFQGKTKVNEI